MQRYIVGHKCVYIDHYINEAAKDQQKDAQLKELYDSLDQSQPAVFLRQKSSQVGFLALQLVVAL